MLYRLSVLLRCASILRGVRETEIHREIVDYLMSVLYSLFQKDFRGSDMDLDVNALLGGSSSLRRFLHRPVTNETCK